MRTLISTFENEMGKKIIINGLRDKVIILKIVEEGLLKKISSLVKEYYFQQYLKKIRSVDDRKSTKEKKKLILAFSFNQSSYGNNIAIRRLSLPHLKEHFGYSPINPNSNFKNGIYINTKDFYDNHILNLSIEEQCTLFDELLKKYGREIIKYGDKTENFYLELIDALINLIRDKGVEYVFNEILRLDDKSRYIYKDFIKLMPELNGGSNGTIILLRQTLSIIGLQLHKNGIILFPLLWIRNQWLDESLFEASVFNMSVDIEKTLSYIYKEKYSKKNTLASFIGLFTCSNCKNYNDYTPMLKYVIKQVLLNNTSRDNSRSILRHLSRLQKLYEVENFIDYWEEYYPEVQNLNKSDLKNSTFSSILINEFGDQIIINEYKDRVIILNDKINIKTLETILKNVKEFLMEQHLKFLNTVDKKTLSRKEDIGDHTILAFITHKVNNEYRSFIKIHVSLLKDYFGYSEVSRNYSKNNTITTNDLYIKHIMPLTIKEQQDLYEKLVLKYGKRIIKFTHKRERFPYEVLEKLIDLLKVKGISYIYNNMLLFIDEGSYCQKFLKNILMMDFGPNVTVAELNKVLGLVGMQLRKHDLVLFPFLWIKKIWKFLDLDEVASKFMSVNVKESIAHFDYLKSKCNEMSLSNEYDTIVGIFLCSTIKSFEDFTPEFKYLIFECGKNFNKKASYLTELKTHLYRIQSSSMLIGKIENWKEYTPPHSRSSTIYLKKELRTYPHLRTWIEFADIYLTKHVSYTVKTVGPHEMALSQWIMFLSRLKNPPLNPMELKRSIHIRNVLKTDDKQYFYDFITKNSSSNKTKNLYLRRVQSFFTYLSENLYPEMGNHIVDSDKLFLGRALNKTSRKRIPSSILSLAKHLVIQDTSYIEVYKNAEDKMYNQVSKEIETIWWPGYKNIMTILLYLPIRNKQARWLDSGELDEYIIDFDKMEYIKNPSPFAIKGRKYCVLQIEMDSITAEKHYVIFISTNKTGNPYIIPYAPKEVVSAIVEQMEFNKLWTKPISKPVIAADKAAKEPEKASKLYPEISPLFRIAVGKITDYQAISAERLQPFYIYLLQGIEKIVNEEGRKIQLVVKNENNKYSALFDIHSLRVTGISELIEAGVPIDIVSQFVAGHANVIMTLYYYITKYDTVKETLERAQNNLESKDSILSILENLEEFEDFMIVNEKEGDSQAIFELLKKEDYMTEISLDGICPGISCSSVGREDKCCPKCSVWITGPMFLVGQTIKINKLLYQIRKSAEKLVKHKKKLIEENNLLRKQNLIANEESEMRVLEAMLTEWGLRYRFIQRSNSIMNEFENMLNSKNTDNKMALIANNSNLPKAKLIESDELGILNHICQAGNIFEESFDNEAQYDLEYLLNKLLQNNGVFPYLVLLNKEDAKKASLILVDGLLSRYNSSELLDMVHGNKELSEDDKEFISKQLNSSDKSIINKTLYLSDTK
jgi:hypothetical protein